MAQTDTRTLQQIKRDTEQARAGLTETVDQLRITVSDTASDIRQRMSPDAIKGEISGYIRSRGEDLVDSVTSAARRNPMQAVAVGASLAYPLLRLARAIPAPILMVGAGLFLAGSKTGQAVTQRSSDAVSDLAKRASDTASDLAEHAGQKARDWRQGVDDTLSAARDYGSDTVSGLKDAVAARAAELQYKATAAATSLSATAQEARLQAGAAGDVVREAVREGQDRSSAAATSVAGATSDLASGLAASTRGAINVGIDGARSTANAVSERTVQATSGLGQTFRDAVEQNPLVVAGIGLLIGGLIAGALPRSEVEDGLAGKASGEVKNRIRDAATKGAAAARDVAGGVYEDVARRAQEQGLTTDKLGAAVADLGQRVRKVTEAAVTTAFETDSKDNHEGTGHGKDL